MTELIKTVRGLDQTGPGQDGGNLNLLWKQITASSDGQFHAAEESSLRWLLKSMNGSTPAAETLRRYPLTWRLLGCVMQRIPLFSMAKSLADRKFMHILQQTLKEISQPEDEPASNGSTKRKRSPAQSFSLPELTTADGCLETGIAIFEALNCLFIRIHASSTLDSAYAQIGAEHLKSLLSATAPDMVELVAPLLKICRLSLIFWHSEHREGSEEWIRIVSDLWDLHLQGSEDLSVAAENIFPTVALIIQELGDVTEEQREASGPALRQRWGADLRTFMQRTLILPSRVVFLNRQDDGPIMSSLKKTDKHINVAAPAFYLLASETAQQLTQSGKNQGNADWMKQVFKAVDAAIQHRDDRTAIMKVVLRQARSLSMPIDTNDLRVVCRRYALGDDETDWDLVANLAQCDPAVFQEGGAGNELLEDICSRTVEETTSDANRKTLSEVLEAIARSFKASRDFAAFLRLWHQQLSEAEQKKLKSSPWTDMGRMGSSTELVSSWIEDNLTQEQLVNILQWVGEQDSGPKTLCLWLNAFSQGIRSNESRDAVGQHIFDLISRVKKSSSTTLSLKWRVVSRAFKWAPLSQRAKNWAVISQPLSKILKKSTIDTAETFEAFKCCSQLWNALSPDGEQIQEVAKLVEDFSARLAAEIKTSGIDGKQLLAYLDSDPESYFQDASSLQQYLAWYLRGATRLNRMYFEKESKVVPPIQQVFQQTGMSSEASEIFWKNLSQNEHCVNEAKLVEHLLDRAIEAVSAAQDGGRPLLEHMRHWISMISNVSLDAFSRSQRERAMAVLMKAAATKSNEQGASLGAWRSLLSLSTKLMSRPTFYEGMKFSDLVDTADALSVALEEPLTSEVLLEMISRFSQMASWTIKQMASHVQDRSIAYFEGASDFIAAFEARFKRDEDVEITSSLRLTLLKALSNELLSTSSGHDQEPLASIPSRAQVILGRCVASVMDEWVQNKKLFSKSVARADLRLLSSVDAAGVGENVPEMQDQKSSSLRKLETRSLEAMKEGDLRGWKMQTFLQKYVSQQLEVPRPATFHNLPNLHNRGRESLLREYVGAIIQSMDTAVKMMYLESLVGEYQGGCQTDGQLVAIQFVVDQLIESPDVQNNTGEFDLATAHTELTRALAETTTRTNAIYICRTLHNLLERKPHFINQSNIESLLSTVAVLAARKPGEDASSVPFIWLCKLVEVVTKKHRLRLEGHYHILLAALQPLLRNLIMHQRDVQSNDVLSHESKAAAFGRLITLMCEPTAGAVARSQHHSTLDSATDEAKRTAGRHMYLVLMQYVKLQLETDFSRSLNEALEPAMNSIFDITPPEGRKILHDAMDAGGRLILEGMLKRYTEFGKWSGV